MSLVREFLKEKDSDYSKYIPPLYPAIAQNKDKINCIIENRTKF